MAKFCEYRDLFKWNKQLMEDDWNDGQKYFLKLTKKGEDSEFTTTAKVAEPVKDSHKFALEQKVKWTSSGPNTELPGAFDCEFKFKNNGEIHGDLKYDYLKNYQGLENVRLLWKGVYNVNATPMQMGFSYMTNDVKYDQLVDTSKDYASTLNCTWQAAPWLILGATKTWKSILDPTNNVTWKMGAAGHFEKALQWGILVDGASPSLQDMFNLKAATLYFNHATKTKTVGAEMKYDVVKKAFGCKVGLKLDEGDHSWKFRLHDSGVARAALQWQMHKVCKTTVDTTVDVKQLLNGSISGLPLGFSFDVKY